MIVKKYLSRSYIINQVKRIGGVFDMEVMKVQVGLLAIKYYTYKHSVVISQWI